MALTDVLFGAANLARTLTGPTRSEDVVAIRAGFAPLFNAARPMAASVYEAADLMEHPLETGAVITDHIVHQPVEIELPVVCVGAAAYRATHAAVRGAYLSGQRLTVTTRTGSYPDMVIADMPHEETAQQFDAISIRIRLREARFVTPQSQLAPAQVKTPAQASTVNRGTQQTTASKPATAARATSTASASSAATTPGAPVSRPSLAYQAIYGGA